MNYSWEFMKLVKNFERETRVWIFRGNFSLKFESSLHQCWNASNHWISDSSNQLTRWWYFRIQISNGKFEFSENISFLQSREFPVEAELLLPGVCKQHSREICRNEIAWKCIRKPFLPAIRGILYVLAKLCNFVWNSIIVTALNSP